MTLDDLADEDIRRREFPVAAEKIFLAHAAVAPLPRVTADVLIEHARAAMIAGPDDYVKALEQIRATRETAARLIGATPEEIALLGPTSLGLSLFAQGLDWAPGDEVLYYADDYPANVYPWLELARRGVVPRALRPERPGEITPELIAASLTGKTRLVALASAYFLTGYRIDVDAIGRLLSERGVLFSLDAIQTLGAFPLSVEYVDFMSADAHKWMLGPLSIGIVYVKRRHFERLRPILIGGANVRSPDFVAQPEIVFLETAARYEPGILNLGPLLGMQASLDLILALGPAAVAGRIGRLVRYLADELGALGFVPAGPVDGPSASGILAVSHPTADSARLFKMLQERRVTVSLRHDRAGRAFLRLSPHFYNTTPELERVVGLVREALP
jgi:cysteine desulfurase/selenocysteine lyase